MENREILIANTKTQKRNKIVTNATTLGELKDALDNAGIDYSGMTFTEGISKTQLLDNATQLPQNVMYKGQPTNNLVILLTNTKKKIASGALSRGGAYAIIKQRGLQDAVKGKFGRNFTQVSTPELVKFIENHTAGNASSAKEDSAEDSAKEAEAPVKAAPSHITVSSSDADSIVSSIVSHVYALADAGVLEVADIKSLSGALDDMIDKLSDDDDDDSEDYSVKTSGGSITDDDVDDMIDDLNL